MRHSVSDEIEPKIP